MQMKCSSTILVLVPDRADPPRLCVLHRWPCTNGYGFDLHSQRGKPGQFIGLVDDESPASAAGLLVGDWLAEINGVKVTSELHPEVVARIKANPNEVAMLVVTMRTRVACVASGIQVGSDMTGVVRIECPRDNPYIETSEATTNDEASSSKVMSDISHGSLLESDSLPSGNAGFVSASSSNRMPEEHAQNGVATSSGFDRPDSSHASMEMTHGTLESAVKSA